MAKACSAVILVHGQGEHQQLQMGSEFAQYVLGAKFSIKEENNHQNPQIRFIPINETELVCREKIEIRYNDDRSDVDLFELYWASAILLNKIEHFFERFSKLLQKKTIDLPKIFKILSARSKLITWIYLIIAIIFTYITLASIFPV